MAWRIVRLVVYRYTDECVAPGHTDSDFDYVRRVSELWCGWSGETQRTKQGKMKRNIPPARLRSPASSPKPQQPYQSADPAVKYQRIINSIWRATRGVSEYLFLSNFKCFHFCFVSECAVLLCRPTGLHLHHILSVLVR